MLKGLTRKLFTLSALVVALAAVSSTSGSPAGRGVYCQRVVNDETCVWYCCSSTGGCWEDPCF